MKITPQITLPFNSFRQLKQHAKKMYEHWKLINKHSIDFETANMSFNICDKYEKLYDLIKEQGS